MSEEFDKSSYVTATKLGSGFAAILLFWETKGHYWDVWQTGIGRYATKEEAEVEAKQWAETEGLRYK